MNEQTITPANEVSFKDFLFKNKRNRTILILAGVAIVVQFAVFKYFYPYASYIHGDSFAYIKAAYYNLSINTYMIGYSKFLRLFSVFTTSDNILVAFQYLFIQGTVLLLLFSLFYLYYPGRIIQIVLLGFMVLNPLFLFLANLISSDGLFLALSIVWFTSLLWIIHKPTMGILSMHMIVLLLAFTVRYNALIYPLISALAFTLSKMPIRRKVAGLGLSILLIGLFISYTGNKYKALNGTWQYSPFSGWQLANNALYIFRYVDSSQRKPVPAKFKQLDNIVRSYFDSTRLIKKHPFEAEMAGTVYMWTPDLPLFKYRELQFRKDTSASEFKKWSSMGPFYSKYGMHIIKEYPFHYARYFLWPNANKYFAPPVEYLGLYNSGYDSVTNTAQVWFEYKNLKLHTRTSTLKISILDFYPIFTGIINAVFLCCIACFILLKEIRKNSPFSKGVFLAITLWLINAAFTIFASSAALRFQSFPIILVSIFSLLLLDWLCKIPDKAEIKNQPPRLETLISDLSSVKA